MRQGRIAEERGSGKRMNRGAEVQERLPEAKRGTFFSNMKCAGSFNGQVY
jgi:hypothetical protein